MIKSSSSFSNDYNYFLMNKNEKILEFRIVKGFDYSIEEVKRFSDKLPIGFISIGSWIYSRQAPKHREFIEKLLELCQINNVKDFLNVTYALSLNDCFWVKPVDSKLEWDDVSLYSNDFNDSIAHLAFNGEGLHGLNVTSTSPEFNTDGSFAKCWVKKNSKIYLLKRGSQGFANSGLEPYSEFYASQLSKEICEDYVDYDLVNYHDELACSCELFSSEKIGYAPILNVLGRNKSVDEVIKYFDSIGSGELFRSMIVLDALILNTDRHLNNYGVIFDNETLRVKCMAPVFDNNMSLLPYAMEDDLNNLEVYLKNKSPKFGNDWIKVARFCLTPRLRRILNNLYGFRFNKHPNYNLPDGRLSDLSSIVNNQIKEILK